MATVSMIQDPNAIPLNPGETLPSGARVIGDATDPLEQKDMFLKLLVAQLKNQDPTNAMDQKDMMAQMAQFSTVEQISNMATTLSGMQASATMTQSVSLIGKQIDYVDEANGVHTDATVTAVATAGGVPQLVLADGTRINPGDVVLVK
jgi:flagellar basal-body rod modification protein FlgD